MIDATSSAVRALIDAPTIALAAARWPARMSRIARPSRGPGVYAQTKRSAASKGNVACCRWPASRPSSQAWTAAVISRAAAVTGCLPAGLRQSLEDRPLDIVERHAVLGHRGAIADRRGAVLERLDVDRHAPRRADLVLAPVQLADRGRVVVDRHDFLRQIVAEPVAELHDLGPLLEQRQHRDLV